jgi:uncharacterized protein
MTPSGAACRGARRGTELAAGAVSTAALARALSRPEAYPALGAASPVSFRQTPGAMLFFVGEPLSGRVYKVKKPVNLGFLDFTTFEARRHFCHEEVRLNRRLAPTIYLGVVPIIRDASGSIRVGADESGEVIDHAVEMVHLPQDRMLSAMLERGEVREEHVGAIAAKLAAFHRECPTGAGVDEHASPDSLRAQVVENLGQMAPFAPSPLSCVAIAFLRASLLRFIDEHEPLLEARMASGRVREGHGDLHAGNICLLGLVPPPSHGESPGAARARSVPAASDSADEARHPPPGPLPQESEGSDIVMYDCIEFTPRFRCCDVAREVAFLAMDLAFRGRRDLATLAADRYAALAADPHLHRVLGFYMAHLAGVRSKVAALSAANPDAPAEERAAASRDAVRYLNLAVGCMLPPSLIVMCGRSGTGKSWAARAIAEALDAVIIRSDVLRKQLAGIEPTQRATQELYEPKNTRRTDAAMVRQSLAALRDGRSVVADGTFARLTLRKPFVSLAALLTIPLLLVQTHASEDVVRRRLAARAEDSAEVSDAGWDVYRRSLSTWQEPEEIPNRRRIIVGPDLLPEEVAALALDAIARQRIGRAERS